jgi:ankyrin repeat protein
MSWVLHEACMSGNLELVEDLLNAGADIEEQTGDGSTPLHAAVWYSQIEVVKYLLDAGANVNIRGGHDLTPLHLAASRGIQPVIHILLAHGADTEAQDDRGLCPRDLAFQTNEYVDMDDEESIAPIMNMLDPLKNGNSSQEVEESINAPYPVLYPFHAMASSGNSSGLQMMLKQAGSTNTAPILNAGDHRGFSVLHKAMESGITELVQMLIDFGADINAEVTGSDPEGWTALHLAAFDNHPDVIELLVKQGANFNHRGKGPTKMTPLRVAVTKNQSECVTKLLALGADPLEKDPKGFTLLHEAMNIGNQDVIQQLLAAGCDPDAKANDGSTPAMWVAD